jgi:hypothetical protein
VGASSRLKGGGYRLQRYLAVSRSHLRSADCPVLSCSPTLANPSTMLMYLSLRGVTTPYEEHLAYLATSDLANPSKDTTSESVPHSDSTASASTVDRHSRPNDGGRTDSDPVPPTFEHLCRLISEGRVDEVEVKRIPEGLNVSDITTRFGPCLHPKS